LCCPIEAALSATLHLKDLVMTFSAAPLLWAQAGFAWAFAPHARVADLFGDTTHRLSSVMAVSAAIATLGVLLVAAPAANRARRAAAYVAAQGPDIDPWTEAGL
jgi:hypothetical protein